MYPGLRAVTLGTVANNKLCKTSSICPFPRQTRDHPIQFLIYLKKKTEQKISEASPTTSEVLEIHFRFKVRTGGKGAGHNFERMTARTHSTDRLESNGPKAADKSTSARPRSSVCVCLVTWSCPTLCNPKGYSSSGFSVLGILQGRMLEWLAILFSRGSSQPRDQTPGLLHCRQIFYH